MDIMSEPAKQKPDPYEVKWLDRPYSRLKYSVVTTGIHIDWNPAWSFIHIGAFNSHGQEAMGYVAIPIREIPNVIAQLQRFHFEHASKNDR